MKNLEKGVEKEVKTFKNNKQIVLYKPRKTTIKLSVESYSAVRYHNQ